MNTDLFKQRRSIRRFRPEQISSKELDLILEAGTYAPTGMNRQSPVMVVIQDAATIRQLEIENARVLRNEQQTPFYGAPTLVVVFADTRCRTGLEDACLVMGNLMNAASVIGVGSCWIHRAKEVFLTDAGKALMAQWGLDENYVGVGNCILGYPAEAPAARPRKENYIIWHHSD